MQRTFRAGLIPPRPDISGFDWTQTRGLQRALEIGAGTGIHALRFALNHPNTFLVALERTHNKFATFQKHLSELSPAPPNLLALQADALWWCAHNLNPLFLLDQVFILYPNPYPKKKQANLRFANMPFMGFLIDHMGPGATLEVSTNERFYFEEVLSALPRDWGLQIAVARELPADFEPRTAFEKKYLARRETCYQGVFRKPNHPTGT